MIRRLLVPYLMGQRRDGLLNVASLDDKPWTVISTPEADAVAIADKNLQLRSMGRIYALLAQQVRDAAAGGEIPLSISGDCVSSMGMLAGLQQAGREPQRLLWLDAHGDFHTWATTQTQYLGGMPLAMLVGRPDRRQEQRDSIAAMRAAVGARPYPEQRIVLSDARDLDPGEDEALRASAIVHCGLDEVLGHLSPNETLYVHFDTDVLDESQRMPALKYHVPGGPDLEQMAALFTHLRGYRVVAVSVSSWHGEQDAGGAAARACLDLLKVLLPG
ncbi:arginase [Massilia sp. Root418]|uniref:arginase family protein n=1 Tax=Massilia sp. Root418 TaxID=1736532 RepID=UPI0006FFD6F0|nr:arginase family protein [Massilia sp. Root418]KQX01387.1 arginase [Massilia sp. Root418]